jgi:pyridoxine/pyridoxamine 5'-phosphate oxidase
MGQYDAGLRVFTVIIIHTRRKSMNNSIELLKQWLSDERQKGAPNPNQAMLSTVQDGIHTELWEK